MSEPYLPIHSEGEAAVAAQQLLDLIGNTPLVEITRMGAGPCQLFLKMESQNPGGSIKDRIGRSMIEAAEKDGRLKPGGTIIEATAGNTGLGLALVAALKGYKLVLIVPDKMSREKIFHLKAMGAEVMLTRSDVGKGHPEYYQDMAERISKETGAFFVNQFGIGQPDRRRTALLRRAENAETRGDFRLRQRQQVSVQDLQRLLADRPGPAQTRAIRRPARLDPPPP